MPTLMTCSTGDLPFPPHCNQTWQTGDFKRYIVIISPVICPLNFELARKDIVPVISSGRAIFLSGVVASAAVLIPGFFKDSSAIGVLPSKSISWDASRTWPTLEPRHSPSPGDESWQSHSSTTIKTHNAKHFYSLHLPSTPRHKIKARTICMACFTETTCRWTDENDGRRWSIGI